MRIDSTRIINLIYKLFITFNNIYINKNLNYVSRSKIIAIGQGEMHFTDASQHNYANHFIISVCVCIERKLYTLNIQTPSTSMSLKLHKGNNSTLLVR